MVFVNGCETLIQTERKTMNNTKKKKMEPVTHIITDVDEMSFNKEHDLWWIWNVDENYKVNGLKPDEILDMDSYEEFISFIKKYVGNYLDKGYSVVALEKEFVIRFTFIKGKTKEKMVVQIAN